MLLTRLYLRNFRVYEDELNLELPPGLVGIFGANGAGKSTLLESVIWTLWGKARTTKEQVRSSGVGGDCVTEVEFEHEGHLYLVRRSLVGANATPKLEAQCDGLVMSEGVRDAERYIESVLGMDDGAFRASVFAEQKQLAAFSDQKPAERLRLVLRLLGITPLDVARDSARKDARQTAADHKRLREMLPDLPALEVEAADADARAGAAEATAAAEASAAAAAQTREADASEALAVLDRKRQEYDGLVLEGKAARQELDGLAELVTRQATELAALEEHAARLPPLEAAAAGMDVTERVVAALGPVIPAVAAVEGIVVGDEPPPADESSVSAAAAAEAEADREVAELTGRAQAAAQTLEAARRMVQRSAGLSGEADCPVCGQALGMAFEKVQAHRAAEAAEAEVRVIEVQARLAEGQSAAEKARRQHTAVTAKAEAAGRRRSDWEQSAERRRQAEAALAAAWADVPGRAGQVLPAASDLESELRQLRMRLTEQRAASDEVQRVRGLLERRPTLMAALDADRERAAAARDQVQALRDKVKALDFDPAALKEAADAYQSARAASLAAVKRAQELAVAAAAERGKADAAAQRVEDARAQHARLVDLEVESRHLGRLADLLSEFRNTVVASVGPRLAAQAAELFGELTDHEYDELQVDPETYQLQIRDAGKLYGLERFSGSEVDLANLALRVAISEHIHFQSGGSVGLMVLDEVFGPLDEDRKARMLLALERLRGRFRQILVVTHDSEIKEQLPSAIEVLKLPGRRATARLATG